MRTKFFLILLLGVILAAGCAPMTSTPEPPPPSPTPEEIIAIQPGVLQSQVLFQALPVEYQDIKIPLYLEEKVNREQAYVLQIPENKTLQRDQVFKVVQDDFYLDRFDFDHLAEYSAENYFVAVPAKTLPEFPDWVDQGVMVGLVYDSNSFYGKSDTPVYEVVFFNDRAELRDRSGMTQARYFLNDGYYLTESVARPEVLPFFIKNGCWLCWNAGGRCGCLICF